MYDGQPSCSLTFHVLKVSCVLNVKDAKDALVAFTCYKLTSLGFSLTGVSGFLQLENSESVFHALLLWLS